MVLFLGKVCKNCDGEDFYIRQHSFCKECHKTNERIRRRTSPAMQEYDRTRAKLPHRVKLRAKISKRWRQENPMAYKAQMKVNNSIRTGKLSKEPCTICGEIKAHAHHKDYSKPLDVVWLCARCHRRIHAAFPELAGITL